MSNDRDAAFNGSTYELVGMHDIGSVTATARILYRRFWRRLLAPVTIGLFLTLVGSMWAWLYEKIAEGFWIFGGIVVIEVALLVTTHIRIRRSLKSRIGKSIQVRLGPENVSWTSGNEAHTLPWSRFKGVSTDGRNLFLFLARTVVLVVPNLDDPEPAARFAWSRIGSSGIAAK